MKVAVAIVLVMNLVYLSMTQVNARSDAMDTLIGAGLTKAAIISFDALIEDKTEGFDLRPSEARWIGFLFKDDPKNALELGLKVEGQHYSGVKAEPESIYGKDGARGVILVKTFNSIIVGVYDENLSAESAADAVEKLGESFRKTGL